MTPFYALSFFVRSMFTLWTLLLCCTDIVGIALSFSVKSYRTVFLSVPAFVLSYFLWQVCSDLRSFGITPQAHTVSVYCGALPWIIWSVALILMTALTTLPIVYNYRYAKTSVTPLSIKYCADKMNCGICFWCDNGHVIFTNECMNRLCMALTRQTLMNGNIFRAAVTESILPIDHRVWHFSCRKTEFNGELLYEMVALDVTEIHQKTETLRRDNEELSRMNESLKAYRLIIDDAVRKQEILQAKVNIHDEMNRLMLATVATDIDNETELKHIFTLWERNALLLCFEADEDKDEDAVCQLGGMARTLGVKLIWHAALPDSLADNQRTLFLVAAREAITNAVKHAEAQKMEISFVETEKMVCCRFVNDGRLPNGEVRFTGGLANLSDMAGRQNAEISVATEEVFTLSLVFNKICQTADAFFETMA